MEWQTIKTAPKDGTEFVWLSPVLVIGEGQPSRIEYSAHVVWRKRSSSDSNGYWASRYTSIADHLFKGYWMPLPEPPSA